MKHSRSGRAFNGLAVAVVVAALALLGAAVAFASVDSNASATRAKRATRLELILRYGLMDAHATHHPVTLKIGCGRVAKRFYRCSFFGVTATDVYVYYVSGKSSVRFARSGGAHTTLYRVSCNTYSLSDYTKFDFC
jgi:hypothetical protein